MSAGGSSAALPEPKNEKEIVRRFQNMMGQQRQMITKLAELEAQRQEYSRVSTTIKPMESGRRCFQLINNVLVERTLGEVVPIVDANLDGLESVIQNINKDLVAQSQELREYQAKYNLRIVNKDQAGGGQQMTAGGQGILA